MFLAPLLAPLLLPLPSQDTFVETGRLLPWIDTLTNTPTCVAAGDVDGDGRTDLVVGTMAEDFLLLSTGAGLFESAVPLPGGAANTAAIALADFDGDGDLDAFLGQTDGTPVVLENQGGALTFGYTLDDALSFITGATTADVDLDGAPDLIICTNFGDQVFLSRSGVLVLDPTAVATVLGGSQDVAAADVDGDGDLDFAIPSSSGAPGVSPTRLYLNDGGGAFAPAPLPKLGADLVDVSFGDLDADGDPDAAVVGFLPPTGMFINTPNGFAPMPGMDEIEAGGARLADLSGDGVLDLLIFGNDVQLFHADPGTSSFVEQTAALVPENAGLRDAVVADLDGDPDLEVFGLGLDGLPTLWLNDAGRLDEFQTVLPYGLLGHIALAVGDVNGDDTVDLLIGTAAENRLYVNDGTGRWTDASDGLVGGTEYTQAIGLADLDGDGDLDTVEPRSFSPPTVGLNDGAGTFTEKPGALPGAAYGVIQLASADLDADGDLDLALGRTGLSASTLIALNDGTASFVESDVAEGPGFIGALRVLDADQDGHLDLLVATFEQTSLHLGDGLGGFGDAQTNVPSGAVSAAVADLDANGFDDVALARYGADELWSNQGGAVFQLASTWVTPDENTVSIALHDLDGDGLDEILTGGVNGSRLYAFDGGAYVLAESFGGGVLARPQLTDLDDDGDLDLLAYDLGRVGQYMHVAGGQIARRTPARIGKPIVMEVFGEPGTPWAAALSPAATSLPLPPFGVLQLDPAQLFLIASGAVPPSGVATFAPVIGPVPSLVGETFHWQAIVGAPLALTNRAPTTISAY